MTTDNRTIRLACTECDRDDFDGITLEELRRCEAEGWEDIAEEQSFEDACRPIEEGDTSGSPMRWFTHLGLCPDCKAGQ